MVPLLQGLVGLYKYQMKKIGLIGRSLEHSFSKEYFTRFFKEKGWLQQYSYSNYELKQIGEVESLIRRESALIGFNVTIPYKEAILPFLSEISHEAALTGAVNTVLIYRNSDTNSLKGFNTDIDGFRQSLSLHISPWHTRALVLGNGGAARAVHYVLESMGIEAASVSRHKTEDRILYEELTDRFIREHPLIINTTPAGMYPDIAACPPIPYAALTTSHLLFDLVYNPEETEFLRMGRSFGATGINGKEMLIFQAQKAWELFSRL
jgi:shikimate dehydrogenase